MDLLEVVLAIFFFKKTLLFLDHHRSQSNLCYETWFETLIIIKYKPKSFKLSIIRPYQFGHS